LHAQRKRKLCAFLDLIQAVGKEGLCPGLPIVAAFCDSLPARLGGMVFNHLNGVPEMNAPRWKGKAEFEIIHY
jgi:hypothetical protein